MGMGPMGGMPPQMLQQLMQAIAAQQGTRQPAQAPPGGGGQQQMPPQLPAQSGQSQMPQFQTGRNTMMLPSGTASPAVPGVPFSATPPRQPSQTRASGIAAIPGAVIAVKQKMQQDKVQKARQLASQYLALKQNGDPQVQKTADAMMMDPKVHKVFDKAVSDPNSAEYQGVQLAYRDQLSQEEYKSKWQQLQANVEQKQEMASRESAMAQQAIATARLRDTQASQMGQVTPAEQAKLDARMQVVTAQIQGRLQQNQQQTKAMLEAVRMRVKSAMDTAKVRAGATIGAAQIRASATQNYIIQEYKALDAQLSDLDRTSTALSSQLTKDTHWYGDDDGKAEVQQKLSQIEAQRAVLTQQFQLLQSKDQAFQRSGLTPPPPSAMQGSGTHQDPIVIP